jgi:hypothetical protein
MQSSSAAKAYWFPTCCMCCYCRTLSRFTASEVAIVAVQQQPPQSWQEQQQAWGLTLPNSCGLCGTDAAGQRLWEQDSIAAPRF